MNLNRAGYDFGLDSELGFNPGPGFVFPHTAISVLIYFSTILFSTVLPALQDNIASQHHNQEAFQSKRGG